ncbi:MAG: DUF4870 domain-containing protein [Endozoicomonas sp. (ex Botrylloides leachii)]|nr:DUF4870 domain-containing protein [Endozoicomonas sp. (ex Botrylloides leachii)]
MQEYQPKRDEKNLAMLVHLLPFLGFMMPGINIIIPLIIWLTQRDKSPYIEHHSREELNFQITLSIIVCAWIILNMLLIGLLLLPLVIITAPLIIIFVFIFMVRAAIMGSRGIYHKYPLSLRLVN